MSKITVLKVGEKDLKFTKVKLFFKNQVTKVALLFLFITLISSSLVLYFEFGAPKTDYKNIWDSIWWAIVTIFTVGYGDKTPITVGGRIVAIMVMFFGVSLVSLITAAISSIFVAKRIREDKGLEAIQYDNHIIICGWNNRAESIIENLLFLAEGAKPNIILINELIEEEVNSILDKFRKQNVRFIRGDYTRQAPLDRANINRAQSVILLPNLAKYDSATADEKTLLATLNIKSNNSKLKIIAFIMNPENEVHVKRAKADRIFISDQYTDFIIANDVLHPGLTNVFSDLLNPKGSNSIVTLPIPGGYLGKTYGEVFLHFKAKNLLPIGIVTEVESISSTDFLSADASYLDAFIEKKLREAGKSFEDQNKILVNLNPEDGYIIQKDEKVVVIK